VDARKLILTLACPDRRGIVYAWPAIAEGGGIRPLAARARVLLHGDRTVLFR